MSDYTPTTEQVRGWYSEGRYAFYPRISNPHSEFDAWLAAHDAAIRADEREKAAQRVRAEVMLWMHKCESTENCLVCLHANLALAAARGDGEQA